MDSNRPSVPDTHQDDKLTQETLREYFANPYRYRYRLPAADNHVMVVDSVEHRIELHVPADGSLKPAPQWLRSIAVLDDEDAGLYVLKVEAGDQPEGAHSLAHAVHQGLTQGRSFQDALDAAVDSFKELVAGRERMNDGQVAGLFGELLVLEHLMNTFDADLALNAWLGPRGEEHDFGLEQVDLEVKTTLSEHRAHVINGVNQLLSRADRELWLVSIQLTRVGQGHGATLDEMCDRLLKRVGARRSELRSLLLEYGWRAEDTGLYGTRMALRSGIRAYHVDEHFPRLTGDILDRSVESAHLISDVHYRVDVAGLTHGIPHNCLTDLVEGN